MAVRKQRGTATTLFDQRREIKRSSHHAKPDTDDGEIEFSPMVGQELEEMRALVPIDIV